MVEAGAGYCSSRSLGGEVLSVRWSLDGQRDYDSRDGW